uniref:Uncharacterized protein LOC104218421 n=1 Tax=Nicotiana sylvestris TaxID=4096 RepID=A0A1U7VYX5_NICSY|nr:PREDICTED: uncharacterized protein LOC104218421 [Nicotiana sylvestris]
MVMDLSGWVDRLDSICPYTERVWRDLSQARWEAKYHGIGEVSSIKETSPGEEDISRPDEGKKRQKESSNEPSKSKKTKVDGVKADPEAFTLEAAGNPRAEGERGNNFLIVSGGGEEGDPIDPCAVETVASEMELDVIVVQLWAGEATKEVLDEVLEPAGGQNIYQAETHSAGGSEEPSSEAL